MFVANNGKKIGRQYQKRRKNMRTSGLFYFGSNDRFKKEPINFICSFDSGFSKNEILELIVFN